MTKTFSSNFLPALAYWLSRYGLYPTIVEQAPALRGGAIDVAERMGILPAIWQASTNMQTRINARP